MLSRNQCVLVYLSFVIINSVAVNCAHANNETNCFESFINSRENILKYYDNLQQDRSESRNRIKRSDQTTFVGRPKTREERWHENFNRNSAKLKIEQTQSLVLLLNKVIDRYMNACIPIIFYDTFVEKSDGIILQLFFQVSYESFIHEAAN